MKKILFLIIILSLMGGLVLMDSCKKDTPINGCMDKDSRNFNALAEKDDGSCLYKVDVVFWYNQEVLNELITEHAEFIKCTINNVWDTYIIPVKSIYWTSAPECFEHNAYSTSIDLDHGKTQSLSLNVTDNTGHEYWTSTLNLVGNTCLKVPLALNNMKRKTSFK